MNMEDSGRKALAFGRPPKIVGALLLAIGLLVLALSVVLVDASPVLRIAGAAVALVGAFAFGFGVLIQVANTSPRRDHEGPKA